MVPSAAACHGRRPKNGSKQRRKGGEKSGSTAGGKLSFLVALVVAFLLSASLGRRSVCLGPGLVAVWSFPALGAGWRSRVPWPLPSWLAAAPVFLVPAPVLAFVRKGDVPRTDPFVSLPVRGFFRYSHVFWRYWEVLWRFIPPPISFVRISLWVSSRFRPASTWRAGSPWRLCVFLFSSRRSLSFAFVLTLLVTGCVSPCTFYVIPTYLDRDEQDLGCKSRNFPAALKLGACLPLLSITRKTPSHILSCLRVLVKDELMLKRHLKIFAALHLQTDKYATRSTWLAQRAWTP